MAIGFEYIPDFHLKYHTTAQINRLMPGINRLLF